MHRKQWVLKFLTAANSGVFGIQNLNFARKASKRNNTLLSMLFDWWGCSSETTRQRALEPKMKTKKNKNGKSSIFLFIVKKYSLSKVFSCQVGCPTSNTTFSHRVMIFPLIKVSEKCDIARFLSKFFSSLFFCSYFHSFSLQLYLSSLPPSPSFISSPN